MGEFPGAVPCKDIVSIFKERKVNGVLARRVQMVQEIQRFTLCSVHCTMHFVHVRADKYLYYQDLSGTDYHTDKLLPEAASHLKQQLYNHLMTLRCCSL